MGYLEWFLCLELWKSTYSFGRLLFYEKAVSTISLATTSVAIGIAIGVLIVPLGETIIEISKKKPAEDNFEYIAENLECSYGLRPVEAVYYHVGKDPVRVVDILNNVCVFEEAVNFEAVLDHCMKSLEQCENGCGCS